MLPTSIATLRGQHLLDAWKRDIAAEATYLQLGVGSMRGFLHKPGREGQGCSRQAPGRGGSG